MICPHCGHEIAAESSAESNGEKDQERDEVSSVSVLFPSSPPICNSTEVVRKTSEKRARGGAYQYPADFEAGWLKTDGTGSKFEAFLAWKTAGRPSARVIGESWARWKQTRGWQEGYIPHVRKWIRGRCFEQAPPSDPVRTKPAPGAAFTKPRVDPYCPTHSSYGLNKPPSFRANEPRTSCPSCQEYQARHAGRVAEPESAEQVLAKLRALRS